MADFKALVSNGSLAIPGSADVVVHIFVHSLEKVIIQKIPCIRDMGYSAHEISPPWNVGNGNASHDSSKAAAQPEGEEERNFQWKVAPIVTVTLSFSWW